MTTASRLLGFLHTRADDGGGVRGVTRAEAAAAIGGTLSAVEAALSRLVIERRVARLEGRAPTGMLAKVRILDPVRFPERGADDADSPTRPWASGGHGLAVTTYRPRFGEPISLPRVRWAEAMAVDVRAGERGR